MPDRKHGGGCICRQIADRDFFLGNRHGGVPGMAPLDQAFSIQTFLLPTLRSR